MVKPGLASIINSMERSLISDMLNLAERVSREAAAISSREFGRTSAALKHDNSVVTDVDYEIQTLILSAIESAYPDHAAVAEETAEPRHTPVDPAAARYCWVIDPLDGTRNFVAGLPCFATAIAVLKEGRPVVGVVYEHNQGALYAATAGGGATLNGEPVTVSSAPVGLELLVGIPSSKDRLTGDVIRTWSETRGLVARNFGSTALHLGLVASGAMAATFSKRAKIWDVAAGALLVTEAGGMITDPLGANLVPFQLGRDPGEDIPFLAAAPDVHRRLIEPIRKLASPREPRD